VLLDLTHPILDALESFTVVDGVGKNDSHRALVIGLGDRFESFLACSIPDLHLDFLSININRLELEINSCQLFINARLYQ
jgi:hypothetical protein